MRFARMLTVAVILAALALAATTARLRDVYDETMRKAAQPAAARQATGPSLEAAIQGMGHGVWETVEPISTSP